jgi:hypothetical protein
MADFSEQILRLEKIRKRKKIAILMIPFLIIVLLVLIKIFFIKPAPSCFDGIQNGMEQGIDCGGPCLPCGIKYAKPIEVISSKVIPETNNTSAVLIQIKNSNLEYGVKFKYTVNLYSAFGEKLKTYTDKDFILPFSTKYLLIQKIDLTKDKINRVEVSFDYTINDWFYSNFKTPDLFDVVDKKLRQTEPGEVGFLELTAQLKNKTNKNFSEVEVVILLYSKTGEIINAAKTEAFNVEAYGTKTITYIWQYAFPDLNILDFYRVEVLTDALE